MAVKILVLGRQEGVDDPLRDHTDRHKNPALGRIFGQQPPVAGMDAGRNRRLVMRQLLVIGQVTPEIPDRQADHAAAGNGQQDETHENKANELNNDAQERTLLNRWRGRPPARRRFLCANTLAIPRPIWLNPSHSLRDARDAGADRGPRQGRRSSLSGRHAGFRTKSLWRQGLAGKLLGANSASWACCLAALRHKPALLASLLPPRRVAAPGESDRMNLEPGCLPPRCR